MLTGERSFSNHGTRETFGFIRHWTLPEDIVTCRLNFAPSCNYSWGPQWLSDRNIVSIKLWIKQQVLHKKGQEQLCWELLQQLFEALQTFFDSWVCSDTHGALKVPIQSLRKLWIYIGRHVCWDFLWRLNMGWDQRVPLLRRRFLLGVSLEWKHSQLCPILLWCRHHYNFLSILLLKKAFPATFACLPLFSRTKPHPYCGTMTASRQRRGSSDLCCL